MRYRISVIESCVSQMDLFLDTSSTHSISKPIHDKFPGSDVAKVDGVDSVHDQSCFSDEYKLLPEWADALVDILCPRIDEIKSRQDTFDFVASVLKRELGSFPISIGSTATRTFLPGSDINITVFLGTAWDLSWFIHADSALCTASLNHDEQGTANRSRIENVSFMNDSNGKVIKLSVDGFQIEISANCMISVYSDALLEQVMCC